MEVAPRIGFDLEIELWTTASRERIAVGLPIPFDHRPAAWEPGTAQRSCFEVDVDATVRACVDPSGRVAAEQVLVALGWT